jgi:F-type H+-transporting ATPase subunit b
MRIDLWTLALQTVNVLVLVWLLSRFLFRPVAAIIAARAAAADTMLADAAAKRAQAEAAAAAIAEQRAGLAAEGARVAAAARAAAAAEHATLLQHARDEAARLQLEARQATARDRDAMRRDLEREATDLAIGIATRLLQRLPPLALAQAFAEGLAATIAADPARAALAGTTLELSAAAPLDAAAQDACRAILSRAVGAPVTLRCHTDPALIAGLELAAPHALIRNSWRADLDRISQSLHAETAAT